MLKPDSVDLNGAPFESESSYQQILKSTQTGSQIFKILKNQSSNL